jgi:hypothetical protein
MRWRKRKPNLADEALAEAQQAREKARARGVRLRALANTLKDIRTVNHLADDVRRALGDSQ